MFTVNELPHLDAHPNMNFDELHKLVMPYLKWELMATSGALTRLLIAEPISSGAGGGRQLLVLEGEVANVWLRYHSSSSQPYS